MLSTGFEALQHFAIPPQGGRARLRGGIEGEKFHEVKFPPAKPGASSVSASATAPCVAPPPPSMESCIHAVVKGADNTVSRLKAADFLLLPPSRGKVGVGVSCVSLCPPFTLRPPPSPSPPPRGGGNIFACFSRVNPGAAPA